MVRNEKNLYNDNNKKPDPSLKKESIDRSNLFNRSISALKQLEQESIMSTHGGTIKELKQIIVKAGNLIKTMNFRNIDEKLMEANKLLADANKLQSTVNDEIKNPIIKHNEEGQTNDNTDGENNSKK